MECDDVPNIKEDTPPEIFNYIYRLTGARASQIAIGMYLWKHYKHDARNRGYYGRKIAKDLLGVDSDVTVELIEKGFE